MIYTTGIPRSLLYDLAIPHNPVVLDLVIIKRVILKFNSYHIPRLAWWLVHRLHIWGRIPCGNRRLEAADTIKNLNLRRTWACKMLMKWNLQGTSIQYNMICYGMISYLVWQWLAPDTDQTELTKDTTPCPHGGALECLLWVFHRDRVIYKKVQL